MDKWEKSATIAVLALGMAACGYPPRNGSTSTSNDAAPAPTVSATALFTEARAALSQAPATVQPVVLARLAALERRQLPQESLRDYAAAFQMALALPTGSGAADPLTVVNARAQDQAERAALAGLADSGQWQQALTLARSGDSDRTFLFGEWLIDVLHSPDLSPDERRQLLELALDQAGDATSTPADMTAALRFLVVVQASREVPTQNRETWAETLVQVLQKAAQASPQTPDMVKAGAAGIGELETYAPAQAASFNNQYAVFGNRQPKYVQAALEEILQQFSPAPPPAPVDPNAALRLALQFPPGQGQLQALALIDSMPQATPAVKARAEGTALGLLTPALIQADPYDAMTLAPRQPAIIPQALAAIEAAASTLEQGYDQGSDGIRAGIDDALLPQAAKIPQALALAATVSWLPALASARRLPGIVKADSLARVAAAHP